MNGEQKLFYIPV